jgi:hypothetical protein
MYETDHEDESKTMVTFVVSDTTIDSTFITTKRITTGSKTKEQILAEAHTSSQEEVGAWVSSFETVGKEWNPETNSLTVKG